MLEFTKQIALNAGEIAKKYFYDDSLKISHKSEKDLVTEADKAVEKLLVKKILNAYPEHEILGEEGTDKQSESEYKWIIDPIDGTTNFAHRIPVFGISIALEKNGEIIIGVVYNPVTGELFYAEKNKGAHLDRLSTDGTKIETKKLSVSKKQHVNESLLATGFHPGYMDALKKNFEYFEKLQVASQTVRRLGAASIDLAYTAAGYFSAYWELKLKPWDMAAGILLVKEAGGKITHVDGSEFSVYGETILATNKHIHEEMLSFLD